MSAVPVLVKELLAWAAQGALLPWGARAAAPPPPAAPSVLGPRRVTYLLHGALAPPSVFWPMRRHLLGKVEGDVVIWGWSGSFDVLELAQRFGAFVAATHPDGPVDLVGHSLGGLIARAWAQELGGAPRVQRLVTLAAPHHGTAAAHLLPQAKDLRPGSDLLRRLDVGASLLSHVRITTVAARGDFMIVPSHRALLARSDAHHLEEVGHNGLLFSPRVFAIVTDALNAR